MITKQKDARMTHEFLEAVNEKYGELSPVQKRIADYMYKYPDEACFYSLREMANALGVTEVTVLRFARKLGFDSYVDMKRICGTISRPGSWETRL